MEFWIFFIFTLGTCMSMEIPEGFLFDVQPRCSATTNGVTKIHILTDLDVHVEGECRDDHIAQFSTVNYVDWYLDALYEGNSLKDCLFTRKNTSNTHILYLSVSWCLPGGIMINHDQYMVTCIIDDHGKAKSEVTHIKRGLMAPREIQAHMGGEASSEFQLKLTDVAGRELEGDVPLGRKVRLTAQMMVSDKPGAKDEVGIRAINCEAKSDNSSYKILRGGCGDGMILPTDVGFKTKGRIAESPVFAAFKLARSDSMVFHCNFTTCSKNCDGDSCQVEKRQKREVGYSEPKTVHTSRIFVQLKRHGPASKVVSKIIDPEEGRVVYENSIDIHTLRAQTSDRTKRSTIEKDDTKVEKDEARDQEMGAVHHNMKTRSLNLVGSPTELDESHSVIARAAAQKETDTVGVDPCKIPGLTMKGCDEHDGSSAASKDFPLAMTSLMVLFVVVFPLLLIIVMAALFCCHTKSYGLDDQTKNIPT